MWYPSSYFTINMFSLKVSEALFHHIPAYLFDMFYAVTGKRTRWVSKKLDHRLNPTWHEKIFSNPNRFDFTRKPIEPFPVWNFLRRINGDSSVTIQSVYSTRCLLKTKKHSTLTSATSSGKVTLKLSFWALDVLFSKMIQVHCHLPEAISTGILNKKISETLLLYNHDCCSINFRLYMVRLLVRLLIFTCSLLAIRNVRRLVAAHLLSKKRL